MGVVRKLLAEMKKELAPPNERVLTELSFIASLEQTDAPERLI